MHLRSSVQWYTHWDEIRKFVRERSLPDICLFSCRCYWFLVRGGLWRLMRYVRPKNWSNVCFKSLLSILFPEFEGGLEDSIYSSVGRNVVYVNWMQYNYNMYRFLVADWDCFICHYAEYIKRLACWVSFSARIIHNCWNIKGRLRIWLWIIIIVIKYGHGDFFWNNLLRICSYPSLDYNTSH